MANRIDNRELTKERLEKAMKCKTADELMTLAKAEGYEITRDEAEAYMAELADFELNDESLKQVAGGKCWTNCITRDLGGDGYQTCDGYSSHR